MEQASPGELLDLIRRGQATTRADLGRATGMSRTAVVSRLSMLSDAGLVVEGAELASNGGRPPGSLGLNAGAGVVLAVAIGRTRSQVGVFDLAGEELSSSSVDHEIGAGPDVVMPNAASGLRRLLAGAPPVMAVGISLPGTVDPVHGVSIDTPVMAGWDGVALAPYLADVAGGDLLVANDADVLARSELLGHAGPADDLIVVKASTGLGTGILAGGTILTGARGGAGDIGHVKVDAAAGVGCRCGDVGCLEAVAGGWALVARMRDEGRDVHHVRDLVDLADHGDTEARELLRDSGRRLGEVLAIAVSLLNPRAVVLGGDMAAAFDVYAGGVRETLYARSTSRAARELQILPSTYGDRAGLVGCAAMALDHVLSPEAVDRRLSRPASSPSE